MDTVKRFEIYTLVSNRHVYVGSAWGKTAGMRRMRHRRGEGGAKALYNAMQKGIEFEFTIVDSGTCTRYEALQVEEKEIARWKELGTHKLLNMNLYPTKYFSPNPDAAARKVLSLAQKRRYAIKEHRETVSAGVRRSWQDPEVRAKHAEGTRRYWENKRKASVEKSV